LAAEVIEMPFAVPAVLVLGLGLAADLMDCADGGRHIELAVLVQCEKDRRDDHLLLLQPEFAQPLEVGFRRSVTNAPQSHRGGY
jgi:hypothetical protein